MSGKLSGGLSEASREALESLVSSGDTSVPGIEASDINDGDIMANTRERVNNNGQFQFVYIPPDGSDPIESDWISQDHKKKVILGWCEGVKGAIISRGQAGMQAANAAAMEAKLRAKREADLAGDDVRGEPVVSRDSSEHVQQPGISSFVKEPPRAANPVPARPMGNNAMDPTDFIEDQLAITRERLAAAEAAQQDIIREVLSARRDYEKWSKLAAALGGGDGSGTTDAGGDNGGGLLQPAQTGSIGTALRSAGPAKPVVQGVRGDVPGVRVQRR